MWQVNCNYKRYNTDTKCPLYVKNLKTLQSMSMLECEKAKKFTLSKENIKGVWEFNRDL